MEQNHIQIIKTGGDPSRYNEFEVIKAEINKLSHPKQPPIDWRLIENTALMLFEKNGIDLLSVSYYTLARYQRYGFTGFVEGCELLSALVCQQWDELWPTQTSSKVDALDWFNSRIGSQIRKQEFRIKDISILQRASDALEKITDKMQQVSLKKSPRIENLFYFIQNNLELLEKNLAAISKQNRPEQMQKTFVYLPDGRYKDNANMEQIKKDLHTDSERPVTDNEAVRITQFEIQNRTTNKMAFSWLSFILGLLLASLCAYGIMKYLDMKREQINGIKGPRLSWFDKQLFKKPDISLIDNSQTRTMVFENYKAQLHEISSFSPLSSYYYANHLFQNINSLWPDKPEYEQLSDYWQNELQAKSTYPIKISNYYNVKTQLQALKAEVDNAISQDKYITISYLRSSLNSIQSELDAHTPVEEILRQLEFYHQTGQTIPNDLKQNLNQRLQAIMARYYLVDRQN